jgi:hypothetical protein
MKATLLAFSLLFASLTLAGLAAAGPDPERPLPPLVEIDCCKDELDPICDIVCSRDIAEIMANPITWAIHCTE